MVKPQFYSRYKDYWLSTLVINNIPRRNYKHWTSWCFRGANGVYGFIKGYDEDYAKEHVRNG